MKALIISTLLSSLFSTAMAQELSNPDIERINKFNLVLQKEEEVIENQISITSKRVPKLFSEKLRDLKAGGDSKALNCIEIKQMFKIQQTKINKYLQFHHKIGLYKKISHQRFSMYDNEIIEYKEKALQALKSCRDLAESELYLKESLEHLKEARKILYGSYPKFI